MGQQGFKDWVSTLQYYTEYEQGELYNKKGVIYSVRAPSIESLKHWAWLLYEPAKDSDSIGHFSMICTKAHISNVIAMANCNKFKLPGLVLCVKLKLGQLVVRNLELTRRKYLYPNATASTHTTATLAIITTSITTTATKAKATTTNSTAPTTTTAIKTKHIKAKNLECIETGKYIQKLDTGCQVDASEILQERLMVLS